MAKSKTSKTEKTAQDDTKKYTIFRNLAGDYDKKPDGFLFSSANALTDEDLHALFNDKTVRDMLPLGEDGKPLKAALVFYHEFNEYQVVITCNSYNIPTLSPLMARYETTVMYEDGADENAALPAGHTEGELVTMRYTNVIDDCSSLYSAQGCEGCPEKGLECVKRNMGYRPWTMRFNYNRASDFDKGLETAGTVLDWDKRAETYGLRGGSYDDIVKTLSKTPIQGFTFVPPNKSRPTEDSRYSRLLRPRREHRFFETSERSPPQADPQK